MVKLPVRPSAFSQCIYIYIYLYTYIYRSFAHYVARSPSIRPFMRPSIRPSVRPFIRQFDFVSLSALPSARLFVRPSIRSSIRPSLLFIIISLPDRLSISPQVNPFVCPSASQSITPSARSSSFAPPSISQFFCDDHQSGTAARRARTCRTCVETGCTVETVAVGASIPGRLSLPTVNTACDPTTDSSGNRVLERTTSVCRKQASVT